METTVELRDEDGCVITQGEGQVFIGGMDRVCLLDDEVTVAPGTMRSTGDWVQIRDTHLYFLGRRDRLVKRHGQRLHLDTLQQVSTISDSMSCQAHITNFPVLSPPPVIDLSILHIPLQVVMSLPQVEACAVGLYEGSRLVAFVVACSTSGEQKATHSSSPVEHQVEHLEETAPSTRGLQKAILHRLSQVLPSHSVPDTLVLVPALPLSSHGE